MFGGEGFMSMCFHLLSVRMVCVRLLMGVPDNSLVFLRMIFFGSCKLGTKSVIEIRYRLIYCSTPYFKMIPLEDTPNAMYCPNTTSYDSNHYLLQPVYRPHGAHHELPQTVSSVYNSVTLLPYVNTYF
jgi:hypothetical protein